MKNLLSILVAMVLIVSACSQRLSLTKRKYTKGYYLSHSHGPVAKNLHVKKTSTPEHREPLVDEPEIQIVPAVELEQATETPANDLKLNDQKIAKRNITQSSHHSTGLANNTFLSKRLDRLMQSKLVTKQMKQKQDTVVGEALSLFWIVLLIILLFYLLGILLDGFGLGWAIHLFALIFLICLILWLLRIV